MKRPLSALLLASTLLACAPRSAAPSVPFSDYVAMGDSITAGVQSAGLTADSQRAAYPVLLGGRAGLTITPPLTGDPGCPPPLNAPDRTVNCQRRDVGVVSPVVAVPGARAIDVLESTDAGAPDPDPVLYDPRVYRLVLGPGITQMQAALARRPKFVTLWIGSNDVLLPTLRGRPDLATPPERFAATYATILDLLAASGARVVVLTVPDVTRVPALIPVRLLRLGGLVDASCDGQDATFFGTPSLAGASREKPLACSGPAALTPDKVALAQRTTAAYNASIGELARARGMAVFDVNPFLARLPGRPLIPSQSAPFGPAFSLDGVHPSSSTHRTLARELARFINGAYGTNLRVGF